jgi:hypothetical protein
MTMKCDFCGEPLHSGRHPLTASGSYDLTGCQLVYLLRRNGELEAQLAAIKQAWQKMHDNSILIERSFQ